MKTQRQTDLTTYLDQTCLGGELDGLQVIRVPVGTFARTQERLYLVQDGEPHGFDTGNQGGGQS